MDHLSFLFSVLLIISVTTITFGYVIKAKNPNGEEQEELRSYQYPTYYPKVARNLKEQEELRSYQYPTYYPKVARNLKEQVELPSYPSLTNLKEQVELPSYPSLTNLKEQVELPSYPSLTNLKEQVELPSYPSPTNLKKYKALLKQLQDAEAKLQKRFSSQDKEDHKSRDEALEEVLNDTENPVERDESTDGRNVHSGSVKFAGGKFRAAAAQEASLEIGVLGGQATGVTSGDEALKEVLNDTENPVERDESTDGKNVHSGSVKFAGGKISAAAAQAASLEIGVVGGQATGV